MSRGLLHVVIPDFDGWTFTRSCIGALRASSYRDFEIIVVDHGQTGETSEKLEQHYPDVIRVKGPPTLWWTGATNLGVRTAMARNAWAVMLLNNDCYVFPETIRELVDRVDPARPMVVAASQIDYASGDRYPLITSCMLLGFPTLSLPRRVAAKRDSSALQPVRLIQGGRGALIPTSVFTEVGLFDEENLPHYCADHDFYMRCRMHNVKLYIAVNAQVRVDKRHTTMAADVGKLPLQDFLATLKERRSHRNVRDLRVFFKRHYPIARLYFIGVALNVARYFVIYFWKRAGFLVGARR